MFDTGDQVRCYFPANISCFPRRLEDVFPIRLQDVFAGSSQDMFARPLAIMSLRRLRRQKNITLQTSRNIFKTSSVHLQQDKCLLVSLYENVEKLSNTMTKVVGNGMICITVM